VNVPNVVRRTLVSVQPTRNHPPTLTTLKLRLRCPVGTARIWALAARLGCMVGVGLPATNHLQPPFLGLVLDETAYFTWAKDQECSRRRPSPLRWRVRLRISVCQVLNHKGSAGTNTTNAPFGLLDKTWSQSVCHAETVGSFRPASFRRCLRADFVPRAGM
jgi:hypothetical protein